MMTPKDVYVPHPDGELFVISRSINSNGISVEKQSAYILSKEEYEKLVPQWIDVNDRLPDNENNVMAILDGDRCIMSYFDFMTDGITHKVWGIVYDSLNGDAFYDDDYEPTHWMPLPKSPFEQ
jgi:hypothetical protein